MDRAEAIKWYENEIRLLEAAPNLNGINGSCMEEEWKKQAEIHKLALAALREQEQREQGCEFCNNRDADTLWEPGEDHEFRLYQNGLYYFDHAFGWEGTEVNFCPMCGRKLKEGV